MTAVIVSPPEPCTEPPSPRVIRSPRISTSIAVTAALAASWAPALLPRGSWVQASLTGGLVAIALACAALWQRFSGRDRRPRPRLRLSTFTVGTLFSVGSAICHVLWQNDIRAATGVESIGWRYCGEVVAGSICIAVILYALGVCAVRAVGKLGRIRTSVLVVALGLLSYFVAVPALWAYSTDGFSAADSVIDGSVIAPTSASRSGSANSLTQWRELGSEGRKFSTGGPESSTVRTYVGLGSAPTLHERVDLAVAEMERAGAFDRAVVIVAVPTGSGWVDENAVTGAERQFGGNTATVALQYSNKPSWATFLFASQDARRSAEALVTAVTNRVAMSPTPPRLVLYGQSLGSVAGSAAYYEAGLVNSQICGAVWAGPPAGSVDPTNAVVLANSSDPVVRWSPSLMISPPDLTHTRIDAPLPGWLPIVSFLQTSVDLVSALDASAGHGHRYGTDQGALLPTCS